jgi:glycerophosphoryl diester phosphodiesterase
MHLRQRAPSWLTASPIAHRGLYDGQGRPENSLAAFRHAVALGVPFEFDVQLTRDGHPVVLHDQDLSRVIGRPVRPITELDLADLATLPVPGDGLPIPTMDEVLELVDGAVPVVVDVRRWGFASDGRLERAVADRMRHYRGDAVLQSFDPMAVHRLSRLLPDSAVGQIAGALRSAGPVLRAIGRTMATNVLTRPGFVAYELSELPSRAVSFWRGRGLPVIAFSTHSPEQEPRARELADNFFFSGYLPPCYRESS